MALTPGARLLLEAERARRERSIVIPDSLKQALDRIAKGEDTTAQQLAVDAIRHFVSAYQAVAKPRGKKRRRNTKVATAKGGAVAGSTSEGEASADAAATSH